MSDSVKDQLASIVRKVMADRRWSASQVAREAGVAPSTITRALDPASSFVPSGRTLEKVAKVYVAPIIAVRDEEVAANVAQARKATRDAMVEIRALPVLGVVEQGAWRGNFTSSGGGLHVPIIDDQWIDDPVGAYRIEGAHTDREFKPGTIIIVNWDLKDGFFEGDITLLRRTADLPSGRMFELTLWDVLAEEGGLKIAPRTTAGEPMALPEEPRMADELDFVGVVIAVYQRIDRSNRRRLAWIGNPTVA